MLFVFLPRGARKTPWKLNNERNIDALRLPSVSGNGGWDQSVSTLVRLEAGPGGTTGLPKTGLEEGREGEKESRRRGWRGWEDEDLSATGTERKCGTTGRGKRKPVHRCVYLDRILQTWGKEWKGLDQDVTVPCAGVGGRRKKGEIKKNNWPKPNL